MQGRAEQWDAFVSHASEDKDSFVRPLVEALGRLGVSLWYDEAVIIAGDSVSRSIDQGIAKSRNGILVISPAFLTKKWPEAESRALLTRSIEEKIRLIPIWHKVTRTDVAAFSPLLVDLRGIPTIDTTAQDIALAVLRSIRPDLYGSKQRSELEKLATGRAYEELHEEMTILKEKVADVTCETCGSAVAERHASYDDEDPNQADVDVFECGYVRGGHSPQACPHDPKFPELTDYDLRCTQSPRGSWLCVARPNTTAAKQHHLGAAGGDTEKQAKDNVTDRYNRGAPVTKRVRIQR